MSRGQSSKQYRMLALLHDTHWSTAASSNSPPAWRCGTSAQSCRRGSRRSSSSGREQKAPSIVPQALTVAPASTSQTAAHRAGTITCKHIQQAHWTWALKSTTVVRMDVWSNDKSLWTSQPEISGPQSDCTLLWTMAAGFNKAPAGQVAVPEIHMKQPMMTVTASLDPPVYAAQQQHLPSAGSQAAAARTWHVGSSAKRTARGTVLAAGSSCCCAPAPCCQGVHAA